MRGHPSLLGDRCTVIILKESRKAERVVHVCKLAGRIVYGLKSAQSSSDNQPSTNCPVPCGQCTQFIPSYCMEAHYEAMHGGAQHMNEQQARQHGVPGRARAAGHDIRGQGTRWRRAVLETTPGSKWLVGPQLGFEEFFC